MQILKFVRRSHGISKKDKPYDMTEVSDGLNSFTLTNGPGIGDELQNMGLNIGDEFAAEVHVSTVFGTLRGTIVRVSPEL